MEYQEKITIIMTKICNKCNKELNINLFHFRKDSKTYRNECKECFYNSRKQYRAKYKKDNVDILKEKNKIYNSLESTKERQNEWKKLNKDHLLEYSREYRVNNTEKISKINKKYYVRNKDKILNKSKLYKNCKYESDVLYRLMIVIRSSINYSLRVKKYIKKSRTQEILGCSFEELKLYLESKFEPWMNWDNQGKYNGEFNFGWDIDHIIPLSSAKTEEEIIKLNHYKNLQPLCSKINRDIKRSN